MMISTETMSVALVSGKFLGKVGLPAPFSSELMYAV